MHLVFCLEEDLLNVFRYCEDASLARLARTCRTLKEPALDILWNCLTDLTPLVRCLPNSLWEKSDSHDYSLKRPLEEAEWGIILGYTRRVRVLRLTQPGLAPTAVNELSNPPPSTMIFPKLSNIQLSWHFYHSILSIAPFVRHLTNPELQHLLLTQPTYIYIKEMGDVAVAFGDGCPNVREFIFSVLAPNHFMYDCNEPISKILCRWTRLTYVSCSAINLTVEALSHLSRCNLRYLSFFPDDAVRCMQSTPSGPPTLIFSALRELVLSSRSLTSVGRFFDYVLCPGLEVLHLNLYSHPTMPAFESFFMTLQGARGYDTLNTLRLEVIGYSRDDENEGDHEGQGRNEDNSEDDDSDEDEESDKDKLPDALFVQAPFSITLQCISPLTVFGNIQSVTFDTPFRVDLNEQQMLLLASSWPRLESFCVGNSCESSVITPGGFLQLLERCRFLRRLDVLLDTRAYKEIPQGHPWRGLTMPQGASISLLHSPIEEESVEALGAFFHVAPFPNFRLETHWGDSDYCGGPREVYDLMGYSHPMDPRAPRLYSRWWSNVFWLAQNMWEERKMLRCSLETQRIQNGHGHENAVVY